ncbi:MetQ/NlpA family ABC transporter substrate-binding protein [Limnochorda pilosa]|uniref:MetQ/NlpA family ABC transporter substrate-binding protein n=1 Tax=Limnochorda pilosa TaxID=1555112 RepID=UPI00082A8725|nr:MetQ/NlpA family ABC transporter substrate-binding protein [Limnochorda pilosa]
MTLVLLVVLGPILHALAGAAGQETIRVGVTAGPHEEVMEVVRDILAEQGVRVEIITFSDYVTPNLVLAEGDLDANSFQHLPYLERFATDHGLKLTAIAPTLNFPMGLYSRRIQQPDELKMGDSVAIPNDPTNGGRALLLLQDAGLIELAPGVDLAATPLDVVGNPKRLRILELDAAQLPRSLEDVALAAINTNYAIEAGLNPVRDAIHLEGAQSRFINVIAVRTEEKDRPIFQKLIAAYHSERVRRFVEERFEGSVIPGWE